MLSSAESRLTVTARFVAAAVLDLLIVYAAFALALFLRFDANVPNDSWEWYPASAGLYAAGFILVGTLFGIYRTAWQYAGVPDILNLSRTVAVPTAIGFGVLLFISPRPIPLSVVLITGMLVFLATATWKMSPRLSKWTPLSSYSASAQRLLIVGAGTTGQLLAREFQSNPQWRFRPVGFIDDDPRKLRHRVHGVPVVGSRRDLPALVGRLGIDMVAIAIPSAAPQVIREAVSVCQAINVPVRMVPGLERVLSGEARPSDLREVTVADLLGREPVETDYSQCVEAIRGKRVLITGASGSIGAELARQVLRLEPAALHLLDVNESGLHELYTQLVRDSDAEIKVWIASVSDRARLGRVFGVAEPQILFHAAAYKHVHLMEEHPDEAFDVNVVGTLNLFEEAQRNGLEKVVFVSTDKAVNPVSVMGATKRVGELLVKALGAEAKTTFCAVRFGNVLGSRGSVVSTFTRQIEEGGPVSVTHPEMARFFLSVEEAVSLVIQAAAFAEQGSIYIFDMGEEIGIEDLARRMIRLKGEPDRPIEIVYTGERPGERLHEVLVGDGEMLAETPNPKVFKIHSSDAPLYSELAEQIRRIERGGAESQAALRQAIHQLAGSVRDAA
ncbi:MAG: nucleoside-diphosphate sugar epimerase/dehydratase [Dehalococcoidia bacterium]